ncbi:phospholipase A2 inhibitor and Ly6/PLAUR domain-containing protein-like [Ambystoma mexicanum]|uniref:phospholipase A2 inhibitor and Ly6/PLAUR domain-containing protein-like n=1 Tax=Ambystoma mexicanum TaxID=8296 RepID=UPI0037E7C43D
MWAFLASLLFALIAAGNSIMCQKCSNRNGTTCSSSLVACDPNVSYCETFIFNAEIGTQSFEIVFKGCKDDKLKDYYISKSAIGAYERAMQVYCKGDGCNSRNIEFTPMNNTMNGVQCPACLNLTGYECKEKVMKNCTGDETNCVHFEGVVDLTGENPMEVAVYGCASALKCNHLPVYPGGIIIYNKYNECTNGKKV